MPSSSSLQTDEQMDRRTDRITKWCPVATLVHKLGCLFPVLLPGFVYLRPSVGTNKMVSLGYFNP